VPVLSTATLVHEMNLPCKCEIYDGSAFQHGAVRQLIDHINLYLISLDPHNERESLEGIDFCYTPWLQERLGQEKSRWWARFRLKQCWKGKLSIQPQFQTTR